MDDTDLVAIPEEMCMEIEVNTINNTEAEKRSMKTLADHVYPRLEEKVLLDGRC